MERMRSEVYFIALERISYTIEIDLTLRFQHNRANSGVLNSDDASNMDIMIKSVNSVPATGGKTAIEHQGRPARPKKLAARRPWLPLSGQYVL